jgi:hypothetical protein
MLKRIVKWSALALLFFVAAVLVLVVYFRSSAIPAHEFDATWYHAQHDWSDSFAKTLRSTHRCAIARAEADHVVSPIGPSRVIHLIDASPDSSGDVFFRFVARFLTSSSDIHLLVVYRWSSREHRFVWKAIEDHSP